MTPPISDGENNQRTDNCTGFLRNQNTAVR